MEDIEAMVYLQPFTLLMITKIIKSQLPLNELAVSLGTIINLSFSHNLLVYDI